MIESLTEISYELNRIAANRSHGVGSLCERRSPLAAFISLLDEKEIDLCLKINRLSRNDRIRKFFAVVSKLGDGSYWVATSFALLSVNGADHLPEVFHIALTAGIGVLLYKILKSSLVRERPFILNNQIACGTAPLDRYSFPSGHTLHAICLTTMFTSVEPLLSVATLPFALLVAISRVVLGLHYPSDVLAGAVIGLLLAGTSLQLL